MKIFLIALLVFNFISFHDIKFSENGELMKLYSAQNIKNVEKCFRVQTPSFVMNFKRDVVYQSSEDVIMGVIVSFDVDQQGQVFIADRSLDKIHAFQSDGTYISSIGRRGQGPGEFAAVSPNTYIKVDPGFLYVPNYANDYNFFPDRVNVFSLDDFSFSQTINLVAENRRDYRAELAGYYPVQIYPRNDGTFLVGYRRMPHDYKDEESYIRYFIQDDMANIVSGMVLEQTDRIQLSYFVRQADIPYLVLHSFSFLGRSLLAFSGNDKLYAARTEEFAIDIHQPDGTLIRTISHPFERVPTSRRELLRYYGERDLSSLGDGVAEAMIREADWLPEAWPALNDLLVDDKNRVWVSTVVEDFDVYEWWVLENTGEVITRFEWPRNEPVEVVKNGYMYTRETDEETGLQQVVRYRIETDY